MAQWGVSPVIDATEFVRPGSPIAAPMSPRHAITRVSRRAGHELKDQFAYNVDLRYESELFYEFHDRNSRNYRDLDARVITANDTDHLRRTRSLARVLAARQERLPKIRSIQNELARIEPGWFQVGGKHDVPKDACHVGRCGSVYVWVGPEGREQLTEFTLTVLKLSSLIKETQTLVNPGNVKFSPGDRGGQEHAQTESATPVG